MKAPVRALEPAESLDALMWNVADAEWCQASGPDIPGAPGSLADARRQHSHRTAAAAHALSAVYRDPRFSDVAGVHWHVHVLCSRSREHSRVL